MTEDREELILINGEYYSHNELVGIIESNKELAKRCERQSTFIRALKADNEHVTVERNQLIDELHHIKNMSMFEFGNTFCTTESLEQDGKRLARSLLGGK